MSGINRAKHLVKHNPALCSGAGYAARSLGEATPKLMLPLQAATTRGPGSTASVGSAGLFSIVTSVKPTALN